MKKNPFFTTLIKKIKNPAIILTQTTWDLQKKKSIHASEKHYKKDSTWGCPPKLTDRKFEYDQVIASYIFKFSCIKVQLFLMQLRYIFIYIYISLLLTE